MKREERTCANRVVVSLSSAQCNGVKQLLGRVSLVHLSFFVERPTAAAGDRHVLLCAYVTSLEGDESGCGLADY